MMISRQLRAATEGLKAEFIASFQNKLKKLIPDAHNTTQRIGTSLSPETEQLTSRLDESILAK